MEAEDIRKKFGELPSRSLGWSLLFALSSILFAIQAIEKLVKGTAFVSTFTLAGITIHNGKPELATSLLIVLSGLCILPIVLAILLAHAVVARQLQEKRITDIQYSKAKAQRSFVETMHAASVIRSRQTPSATHTAKTLETIHVVYRIHKDFTASITKQFKIKAAADALHFWETSIQPTSHADPVEYLSDVGFKVSDITIPTNRTPLTYLQTQNDVRHKSICIYFLPRLLETDPARTIEVDFRWPLYLAQVRNTGREDLFQNYNSAGITQTFTMDIWFEEGNGGTCGLDIVSAYPHQRLPLQETGWSGFRYQTENLPPGRQEHRLSVTWTKS